MMAWLVLAIGLLLAAAGTTVAVGAAAVSRVELTRWISQRLRGAAVASSILSTPGPVLRGANAVAAVGVLAVGLGVAGVLADLSAVTRVVVILVLGIPLLASVAYGLPRALGQRWHEGIVRRATPWIERFAPLFGPVRPPAEASPGSELATVLRVGGAEDLLEPDELAVVSGALAFTTRPVRDVMTPRTDVVALEEGAPLEQVGRIFAESGYSRLPVYRSTLDDIVGMIYAFDLLKVTPGGELPIRPVTVAPGSKPCAALLLEMQRERRQFAVVLDEFGGTSGIVTLEDLLEELVGEIFEEEVAEVAADGAEIIEVDGATPTSDVAGRFGVKLPGDAETLGGFLAREVGRIPQAGERFALGDLEFDVLEATAQKIERVMVRRGPVHPSRIVPKVPK